MEALSPADRTLQTQEEGSAMSQVGDLASSGDGRNRSESSHVVDDFFERKGKRRDSLCNHDRRSLAQPKPITEHPTLVRPGLGLSCPFPDRHSRSLQAQSSFHSLRRSIIGAPNALLACHCRVRVSWLRPRRNVRCILRIPLCVHGVSFPKQSRLSTHDLALNNSVN